MLSRAALLFVSQLPRESRRIDLTVIRVLYGGFALSLMHTISGLDPVNTGLSLLRAMTVVHTALAILLAVRLSGDVAGSRNSGVLGLLALSGISPREAIASQLMLATTSFLSVWLIRVPILVLIFHLGGTTLWQILCIEILLLGLFGMILCTGLLWAHHTVDRATARLTMAVPVVIELIFALPAVISTQLQSILLINVPAALDLWLQRFRGFGAFFGLYSAAKSLHPSLLCLLPVLVHTGLAWLSLWALRRVYFARLDEAVGTGGPDVEPVTHSKPKSQSRPSRPVWNDALAWQAFHLHSNGRLNVAVRCCIVVVCVALMVAAGLSSDQSFQEQAIVYLLIASFGMLITGRGKVSDCLQREIKESTIPMLLLTPHTPLELCDGWGRGARRITRPDLFLFGFMVVYVVAYSPEEGAPFLVDVGALLMSSSPFLVLSPLVPWTFRGVFSGLKLIGVLILMAVIVVALSVNINPWLGTAVAMPLLIAWNAMARRMIPVWFAQKQDELV